MAGPLVVAKDEATATGTMKGIITTTTAIMSLKGITLLPSHTAAMVTTPSYSVDTNWYTDTCATDHVTADLDRISIREKY